MKYITILKWLPVYYAILGTMNLFIGREVIGILWIIVALLLADFVGLKNG